MAGSKSKFLTFLNTKTALKTESKFYQAGSFFRKKCNCIQLLVNGMEYLYRTICHILPLLVHTWSIYGIFILLNTHRILPQISTTTRVKYLATVGEGQSMIWPIDPPDVQEKWKKIILPDILIPKTQEFLKLFAVGLFSDCCCCFSFFFPEHPLQPPVCEAIRRCVPEERHESGDGTRLSLLGPRKFQSHAYFWDSYPLLKSQKNTKER